MEWVEVDLPLVEGGDEPLDSLEILFCIALELVAAAVDILTAQKNSLLLRHEFGGSNFITALIRYQIARDLSARSRSACCAGVRGNSLYKQRFLPEEPSAP